MKSRETRFLPGVLTIAAYVLLFAYSDNAHSQARMLELPPVDEVPSEDHGGLDDIDKNFRKIEKALDSDKPVSVPFPVLLKRTDRYLLSEVCYWGVVMTVRDSLAGSTVLVNVRTAEGLRPQNVALVESLDPTSLLPGNDVSFCGIVMGRTFVLVQPSAGHDAVQFDATKLRRVQRPAGKAKSPGLPKPPEQRQCPTVP